jgi:hypothetical protein
VRLARRSAHPAWPQPAGRGSHCGLRHSQWTGRPWGPRRYPSVILKGRPQAAHGPSASRRSWAAPSLSRFDHEMLSVAFAPAHRIWKNSPCWNSTKLPDSIGFEQAEQAGSCCVPGRAMGLSA